MFDARSLPNGWFHRLPSRLLLALSIMGQIAPLARADQIYFRGGGHVEGEISPDPTDPSRVQIWLFNGKNPLSFQKKQIERAEPKDTALDTYLAKRASASADAESQHTLGEWCEANKLPGLAHAHYEAALVKDKDFEPAHRKLGHVQHDGRWLSRDEAMLAQGLIKYRGKWITPDEKAQFESNAKLAGNQQSLFRQYRLLRQALIDGDEKNRRRAEQELSKIREPEAVAPLVRVFGNDDPERRDLLARLLGQIKGPEAASALVTRLLAENDPQVRRSVVDQLRLFEERFIEARLTRALHSSNIAVVNRAAWAIGQLGLVSAVPRLIPALISTEEQTVWTNQEGSVINDPSTVTTGGVASGPYYPPQGALLADNGSSFAILTPPAVGPGAVAFGAVSVPYSAYLGGPAAYGTGSPGVGATYFTPGPATASPSRGPIMRIVVVPYENLEVHNALASLTGKDFGYDIAAWKSWLRNDFNPNPLPAKRVPQP